MDKNNKKSRYENFMDAAKNTTKSNIYIPRCLHKIQLIMNKVNI